MAKKISLTIDGQQIQVDEGTTLLHAARELGIEIPTMCYLENHKPYGSCFMCVVKVEGKANLVPSCATPAMEGMVVHTDTVEVRVARKMAMELMLSDHLGDCFAPCTLNCPTGIDIPGFIDALRRKDAEEAIAIIKGSLPLPAVLGRVCPAPCEQPCRRQLVDEPVSICFLKRFAADQDMAKPLEERYVPAKLPATGKKVAIIGAGPGGLAAAYFLEAMGHHAVVFDAHPKPGGMLRYGIPEYRLPRDVIDEEVAIIERLGAEFHYNKVLGRDFTLEDLRKEYDAVLLAIGAQKSSSMRVDGEDTPGVLSGIEFLEKVSKGECEQVKENSRVIVVGGGNTAIDAARTAIRLGCDVSIVYRRTRKEMPAFEFEIHEAEEEGVKFHFLVNPVKIRPNDDGTLTVTLIKMELGEPDASGRRRPVPIEGSEFDMVVDHVISAIGQKVDTSFLQDFGLEFTRWNTIVVDDNTMQTSLPDVFAVGDAVLGPDIAVRAAGMGKLAAVSIDQFLRGREVVGDRKLFADLMGDLEDIPTAVYEKYEKKPRVKMRTMPPEKARSSFEEVMLGFDWDQVVEEASRCMQCGCREADTCKLREYSEVYEAEDQMFEIGGKKRGYYVDDSHPVIQLETNKCITCGNCVRVCEEDKKCYALAFEKRGFETRVRPPMGKLLVETSCDGCGMCVDVCPTGALTYKTQPVRTKTIYARILPDPIKTELPDSPQA